MSSGTRALRFGISGRCLKYWKKKNGQRRLYNSEGGLVDTYYETMTFPADPHLTLVIYLPETDTPGSSTVSSDRNLVP
jgi:hypothetical protein